MFPQTRQGVKPVEPQPWTTHATMVNLSQYDLHGRNGEVAGVKAQIPFVGWGKADPLVLIFHEQEEGETISAVRFGGRDALIAYSR